MSRDDTDIHDEAPASKRPKLVNGNSTRYHNHPARIFVPFRASFITVSRVKQVFLLILILFLDRRTCVIYGSSVQFNSSWKDHLPDYYLCREMSSHLRPSKRVKSGVSDTSPNSVQYHVHIFMEGSSICCVGGRDILERGGRVGIQEREEG